MAKKKTSSYEEYYNQAKADYDKYSSGGSGKGYWTAVDDKNWKYTDQYGNSTTDVKNPDGSYKYGSTWDKNAGKWVGTDSLVDANAKKQYAENAMGYFGSMMEAEREAARREAERQSAIEEAYAAQRRVELERQQAQIGQINNLRPEYNQQAEMTAQQAYINKMLAEKGLNEKLAANGLSGTGVSESAKISNENNYGNSLNQTLQARDDALRGLDNQIQAVQSGGNANLSAIEAAYQQQVLNALEQQRQEEWQMKQYQDAMAQQQWQNQFAQNQFNTANSQWQQQFDYQRQQDALAAQQALQAAAARSYSSGGSSGSTKSSGMKISEVDKIIQENLKNGYLPSQDLLDAYSNYYGHDVTLPSNNDNVNWLVSRVKEGQRYNTFKAADKQTEAKLVSDYLNAIMASNPQYTQLDIIQALRQLGY